MNLARRIWRLGMAAAMFRAAAGDGVYSRPLSWDLRLEPARPGQRRGRRWPGATRQSSVRSCPRWC